MSTQGEGGPLHPEERGLEQTLPSKPSKGTSPADCPILDFGPQNCETIHFCYLSHPICVALLQQPEQMNPEGNRGWWGGDLMGGLRWPL